MTVPPLTLYADSRSGNAYKVALLLSLTGTPYSYHPVDLGKGETASDAYRQINPFGTVPALRHGERVLRQSNTILLYLASLTGQYEPADPLELMEVTEWMFWEQQALYPGVGTTRLLTKIRKGPPDVVARYRAIGEQALDVLERRLSAEPWLVGARPTVADVAVFGYARLAEEGGFETRTRPAVCAWRHAIKALPGYGEAPTLMTAG